MPKNTGRNTKMVEDDAGTTEMDNLVPKKPIEIIAITTDTKGNILGLGNNGKIYYYSNINEDWVMQ
jgi:hypothetical protein